MRILRAIAPFFCSITTAFAQNPIPPSIEARPEEAEGKGLYMILEKRLHIQTCTAI